MSGRLATVSAFAYTVGGGLMLAALHAYATGPGGATPEDRSVRLATLGFLAGAALLALPAMLRRLAAQRSLERAAPTEPPSGRDQDAGR